jgi:hypothetical protein
MPHRSIVAVVVVAWLAANSLLFYREVWPHWRAGGPPPYAIDLTEELGKTHVNWTIQMGGKDAGRADSHVERQRDRTYRLRTNLRFTNFRILDLELPRISTTYHINEEGELLDLAVVFQVRLKNKNIDLPDTELTLEGVVKDGEIAPRLLFDGNEVPVGEGKVAISESGSILNPMQLLNRVPGLAEGRRWRMPMFDPMKALKGFPIFAAVLPAAEKMSTPYLDAEVVADTLRWNDEDVPCYKIEYRKQNELDPVAATWVRRRDGLVLQQQSSSGLMDMTLVRDGAR